VSDCLLCQQHLDADEVSRVVCCRCQARTARQLAELPDLYEKLADDLAPAGGADGPRVSGTRGDRLPVNEDVLELRGWSGMVDALLVHEDDWRRELRLPATPRRGRAEPTLRGCVMFLAAHLWWACEKYPHVDGLAADVAKLHGAAESIVAPRDPRLRPVRVGPCPALVDGKEPCGAILWLHPGEKAVTCRWCRAVYPQAVWGRMKVWMDEDAAACDAEEQEQEQERATNGPAGAVT
jgi:hypothetical protein